MIFLDMDGVLANFVQASIEAHERPDTHEQITDWDYYKAWGLSTQQFWDKCRGVQFWARLPEYPWAGRLVSKCQQLTETYFLTSPSSTGRAECIRGKELWLLPPQCRNMIPTEHKHLIAAPGRVLVDDSEPNITKWIAHGGIGLGFKQPWNKFELDADGVIKELERLFAK